MASVTLNVWQHDGLHIIMGVHRICLLQEVIELAYEDALDGGGAPSSSPGGPAGGSPVWHSGPGGPSDPDDDSHDGHGGPGGPDGGGPGGHWGPGGPDSGGPGGSGGPGSDDDGSEEGTSDEDFERLRCEAHLIIPLKSNISAKENMTNAIVRLTVVHI